MRAMTLVLLLAAAGCGESYPGQSSNVVSVKDTDPAMNAAMEKARATLDQFSAALQKPGPKQSDFSLKAKFQEGEKIEHMWINSPIVSGDSIKGKLGNDPDNLKKVRMGMIVTVTRDRVSDWMYVDDGKLVGGYTLRVLRDKMSAKERREFDASVPFKIE